MDIRVLTDRLAVSPQINPEDVPAIAAAGYKAILCNRPDGEVPPSHAADAIRAAAEAAGLAFDYLPVTHQTMTDDIVAQQAGILDRADGGAVLAYCASGTRSCIMWALTQAGHLAPDEIVATAAQAGYDLSAMMR